MTGTPTITSTPTLTGTPTMTGTPTDTRTNTPTPSWTPIPELSLSLPYPNPSPGDEVSWVVNGFGPIRVRLDVFTTAFRKIDTREIWASTGERIRWLARGADGKAVANGVYYIRIEATADGKTIQRLDKVIILR